MPGVEDLNAQMEIVDVTVKFNVTGLGAQPVTLNPDGETDGSKVMDPVRWLIAEIVTLVCGFDAPELKLTELDPETVKSDTITEMIREWDNVPLRPTTVAV